MFQIHFGKDVKDSIPNMHWIKKISNSDLRFLKEVKWPISRVSLNDSLSSSNLQRKKQDGIDYRAVLAFTGHFAAVLKSFTDLLADLGNHIAFPASVSQSARSE